jgi:hypothetical protein
LELRNSREFPVREGKSRKAMRKETRGCMGNKSKAGVLVRLRMRDPEAACPADEGPAESGKTLKDAAEHKSRQGNSQERIHGVGQLVFGSL